MVLNKIASIALCVLLPLSFAYGQTGFTICVLVSDTVQLPVDTAIYLLSIHDHIQVEKQEKKASLSQIKKWLAGMGIQAEDTLIPGLPALSNGEKENDHNLIVKLSDPEKMEAIQYLQAQWGNVECQLLSKISSRKDEGLMKLTEKLLDQGNKRATIFAEAWGKQLGKLLHMREIPFAAPVSYGWTIYPPLAALPDFTPTDNKSAIELSLELTYELK